MTYAHFIAAAHIGRSFDRGQSDEGHGVVARNSVVTIDGMFRAGITVWGWFWIVAWIWSPTVASHSGTRWGQGPFNFLTRTSEGYRLHLFGLVLVVVTTLLLTTIAGAGLQTLLRRSSSWRDSSLVFRVLVAVALLGFLGSILFFLVRPKM